MPDPVTGLIIGGTMLGSSLLGADSARKAGNQQKDAAEAGIAENRRQYEAMQELLAPYVKAGLPALAGQQDLLGLNGPGAQKNAIDALSGSPQMQAMQQQGENAILQNASATGGLRGGNTQAALAQFRPQLLNQMIQQQYSNLGGLTNMGQNSAAGVGQAGMNTGQQIAGLLQQGGAAQAGSTLGQANAYGKLLNMPAQFLGMQYGAGQTPGFGGLF